MTATHRSFFVTWLLVLIFLAGCATPPPARQYATQLSRAERSLRLGDSRRFPDRKRAGHYLDAANLALSIAERRARNDQPNHRAVTIYNSASANLTVLLRDDPALWQSRLVIPGGAPGVSYHLTLQGGDRKRGFWSPRLFTDFERTRKVKRRRDFKSNHVQPGYGGTLVGIVKTGYERTPRDPFAYRVGRSAPVTATLAFRPGTGARRDVTLTLNDPTRRSTVPGEAGSLPLAADYTAPLAWSPRWSEFWAGLGAMFRVEKFLGFTGLYMLQPYDPDRIPVLFIHGLASTPQMWLNDINELMGDPALRQRYQFWVYWYPTGAPIAYSAFRLRQDLDAVEARYGLPHGMILIGHSMGGILARMQATNTERYLWDGTFGDAAPSLLARLPPESNLTKALIFRPNPAVDRVVFICTPHRGSEMALTSIGALGTRLISLPMAFIDGLKDTLGASFDLLTGGKGFGSLTSIQGLSPRNPMLTTLANLPIEAPFHSIIGDRGRGDTPLSSDGVVPYWSSHVDGAESELIVPGPHGSFQLPQTIDELRRILHQHLQEGS